MTQSVMNAWGKDYICLQNHLTPGIDYRFI